MKKILLLCLLCFVLIDASAQTPIAPSYVKDRLHRTTTKHISHLAYDVGLDTIINLPLYVSHAINKEIILAGEVSRPRPKSPRYPKDPSYSQLKSDAYNNTGYDHGHLAPARDFKWNEQAWNECFYMTNMAPQHACLNQRGWCFLETLCRLWAEQSSEDDIFYIVSGAVPNEYKDTLILKKKIKIMVPNRFYKVVLQYNVLTKEAKGIGFILKNGNVDNEQAILSKVSIDDVERLTGLDFFDFLDDAVEAVFEPLIGDFDFNFRSECPSKSCEKIYHKRTRPKVWE